MGGTEADFPVLLGIDVGGTFTDAALVCSGHLFRAKVLTTVDQSDGVLEAARQVLKQAGIESSQVSYFAHGMTTATNALLERKGARTASVATEGFRDLLEIGRQNRSRLYDLCPQRPDPLVPEEMRLVARERVAPQGEIVPLDEAEVDRIVDELGRLRPEAVAVCLLFSFLDSGHETKIGAAIKKRIPGVHVSLSSKVLPQFREYERFSTTAVDAYLTPVVARYLNRLGERASGAGLPDPAIMQSSGGVLPLAQAAASAVPLLLSGPAAGAVGAVFAGKRSGIDNLIAFDMGGTSTDAALVRGGSVETTIEREIGGQPVGLPMVNIYTIGAGGGSIAWIDAGGALRVGPQSAGSLPGPACYGLGGEQATVSDANFYLGYLGERLGGETGLVLVPEASQTALERLAAELGLSIEETALGIRRVVGAEMVKALRVISVEQGHDPRQLVLVAFGGAGPMHAVDLAEELGAGRVMVPESCGVLSAVGMVVGDQRRDWVQTVYTGDKWDERSLKAAFAGLEAVHAAGLKAARLIRSADLRYRGQSHELTVEVPEGFSASGLVEAFEQEHEKAFGYRAVGESVELINIRLTALRSLEAPRIAGAFRYAGGKRRTRMAYFAAEWVEAEVWRRELLGPEPVPGPAIIEEDEATTVVPPGWLAILDESGNLWLDKYRDGC